MGRRREDREEGTDACPPATFSLLYREGFPTAAPTGRWGRGPVASSRVISELSSSDAASKSAVEIPATPCGVRPTQSQLLRCLL